MRRSVVFKVKLCSHLINIGVLTEPDFSLAPIPYNPYPQEPVELAKAPCLIAGHEALFKAFQMG